MSNHAPIVELHARIDGGPERKFVGRFAWALAELIKAGDRGITSLENPAPRLAHYIFRLRREGVMVETVTEPHTGPFSGSHARYKLASTVDVKQVVRAGESRDAA